MRKVSVVTPSGGRCHLRPILMNSVASAEGGGCRQQVTIAADLTGPNARPKFS
jgi:hypothetical protein